jgi:hypothetical protein
MIDPTLTERLTESQTGYSHESETGSVAGSLSNSDYGGSPTTKAPMHPASEQSGKLSSIIFDRFDLESIILFLLKVQYVNCVILFLHFLIVFHIGQQQ